MANVCNGPFARRELIAVINDHCYRRLGVLPDLQAPRGYNDKINWLKLYDQMHEQVPVRPAGGPERAHKRPGRNARTGPVSVVLTSARAALTGSITTSRAPTSRTARHTSSHCGPGWDSPPRSAAASHSGAGSGATCTAAGTLPALHQVSRCAIRAGASS